MYVYPRFEGLFAGVGQQGLILPRSYGLEADIVLHLEDGRYALIECKLGSRDIDEGASILLEIKRLIRQKYAAERQIPLREPDLLIVLTGGEFAYTRENGVKVIPLGCLKD